MHVQADKQDGPVASGGGRAQDRFGTGGPARAARGGLRLDSFGFAE